MITNQDYKSMMMGCFKQHRMRLLFAVIVVQLLNALMGYANLYLFANMNMSSLLIYFLCFSILLIINFKVLFMFLSSLRGVYDFKEELKYALKCFPLELAFTFIMSILSTFSVFVLVFLFSSLPLVLNICSFLISAMVVFIQCFFAYALYDQSRGIFKMIKASLLILKRNWKCIVRAFLPYVTFSFIVAIIIQMFLENVALGELSIVEAIDNLFKASKMGEAYLLVGLYLLNYLGAAFLLTYLYLYLAQVYEVGKSIFPQKSMILEGTITIDIEETKEQD